MRPTLIAVMPALLAAGCATLEPRGPSAVATLEAAPGSPVWGGVSFTEQDGKVIVRADVRNLRSGGEFGFHVHEKGHCMPPDFVSAGGHFNPGGQVHGHPDKAPRHAGDLRNLNADTEGAATYVFATSLLTVRPGPASVVGRTVVIHAHADDYAAQPAGNSGPRIACGLIRAVE